MNLDNYAIPFEVYKEDSPLKNNNNQIQKSISDSDPEKSTGSVRKEYSVDSEDQELKLVPEKEKYSLTISSPNNRKYTVDDKTRNSEVCMVVLLLV